MVRIRTGGLVAVLAFGLLGAGACKKNKSGASGSAAAANDLSLLPADSDLVLSINVAQLRASAMWKDFGKKAVEKATSDNNELKDFQTACGVDPFADITSVAMGVKGFGDKPEKVVVVVHGLPKAKLTAPACFDKIKAESAKDGGSITKDGDVYLAKDSDGTSTSIMFTSDDTVLVTSGTALGTKDAIQQVAKGSSGLKSSAAFNDMFKNVNSSQSMWMVLNTSSPEFAGKFAELGASPKAVWGSVNITDGISADGGARFASADEAKAVSDKVNQQAMMAKAFVDKLDIKADGSDVKGSIVIGKAKLDQLKQQFGGMLGLGGAGAQ